MRIIYDGTLSGAYSMLKSLKHGNSEFQKFISHAGSSLGYERAQFFGDFSIPIHHYKHSIIPGFEELRPVVMINTPVYGEGHIAVSVSGLKGEDFTKDNSLSILEYVIDTAQNPDLKKDRLGIKSFKAFNPGVGSWLTWLGVAYDGSSFPPAPAYVARVEEAAFKELPGFDLSEFTLSSENEGYEGKTVSYQIQTGNNGVDVAEIRASDPDDILRKNDIFRFSGELSHMLTGTNIFFWAKGDSWQLIKKGYEWNHMRPVVLI